MVSSKLLVRGVFLVLILGSLLVVGGAYATAAFNSSPAETAADRYASGNTDPAVAPANGTTVIATDSNSWLGQKSDNPRSKAELIATAPNGSVSYYNDSHTRYWDVDPVPGTNATVEYAYADHMNASQCPAFQEDAYYDSNEYANSVDRSTWQAYARASMDASSGACTRNGIERVNLSTGEVTPIYSVPTPGKESTRWHDADRINDTHLAVADIYLDRVFIVNTTSKRITWSWNARDAPEQFDPSQTGGPHPTDWTHMNDVEVLPDGRLMASPRNNDRVIFLDPRQPPTEALDTNWTLGAEDETDTLYEQHNPDYIPPKQGGPAVLVADSENNRVVEYQRENGEWNRTWSWSDSRAQWIRDADRLPNGHTLISDSNGNRVFEVNRQGEIVWQTETAFPYEAERLTTDDESAGGPSAQSTALAARNSGPIEQAWLGVKDVLAGPAFSAIYYVAPYWVGMVELVALIVFGVSVLGWLLAEGWWAIRPRVSLPRVGEQ